eukprot:9485839-Pyramimonas_sp.AAC.1
MVEYYQRVLAIRDKQLVSPQVRADQAHKTIEQLESDLAKESGVLEGLQQQVTKQEGKVAALLGHIEQQEEIYKEAIRELHAGVTPVAEAKAPM